MKKKTQSEIIVEENSPGEINIRCSKGGALVRVNKYGMFCATPNCVCEQESTAAGHAMEALIKDFVKNNF